MNPEAASVLHEAAQVVANSFDGLRSLESSKEQRYLLKTASDGLRNAAVVVVDAASPLPEEGGPSSSTSAGGAASPRQGSVEASTTSTTTTTGRTTLFEAVNYAAAVLRGYLGYAVTAYTHNNKAHSRLVEAILDVVILWFHAKLVPVNATWSPPPLVVPQHVTDNVLSKMFRRTVTTSNVTTDAAASAGGTGTPSAAGAIRVYDAVVTAAATLVQSVNPSDATGYNGLGAMAAALSPQDGYFVLPAGQEGAGPLAATWCPTSDGTAPIALRGQSFLVCLHTIVALSTRTGTVNLAAIGKTTLTLLIAALLKEMEQPPSSSSASRHNSPVTPCVVDFIELCIWCLSDNATTSNNNNSSTANTTAIGTSFTVPPVCTLTIHRSLDCLTTCLSLLLQMFVNCGPSFRKSIPIQQCVKRCVFPCVMQRTLSTELDLFRLSVNIISSLQHPFGQLLIVESGTFYNHVLFRILEARHATEAQKRIVLEVIRRMAEEPKVLLHVYLNYDCDTRLENVYERMIQILLDVIHGGSSNGATIAAASTSAAAAGGSGSAVKTQSGGLHGRTESVAQPIVVNSHFSEMSLLQRDALFVFLRIADAHVEWIERFEDQRDDVDRRINSVEDSEELLETHLGGGGPLLSPQHSSSEINVLDFASTGSAAMTLATASEPQFVHAKRLKGLLSQFFSLLNHDKKPEKAITFLTHSAEELLPSELEVEFASREASVEIGASSPSHSVAGGGDTDSDAESPLHLGGTRRASSRAPATLARRVAYFLIQQSHSIDKLVLGEFFAKAIRNEFHQAIFEAWIEQHDFGGLTLDEALRDFLGDFKLLGEAQVVDRTMELFAAHYCRHNPSAFSSANTAFILSFSIVMLNTDAHSAHVKEKMSKEGFLRNNRGIDDNKDVDPELLSAIYDRITKNEIRLKPTAQLDAQRRGKRQQEDPSNVPSASGFAVLEGIPLLRHLYPLAEKVGDTVWMPVDAAGNVFFNSAQRKRDEAFKTELHEVLRNAMSLMRSNLEQQQGGGSSSTREKGGSIVEADSVEHAVPMWDCSVEPIVEALQIALRELCQSVRSAAAAPRTPQSTAAVVEAGSFVTDMSAGPVGAAVTPTASSPPNAQGLTAFDADMIFRGVKTTIRACAAFGTAAPAQRLIEALYELCMLSNVIHVTAPATTATTNSSRSAAVDETRPATILVDQQPSRLRLRCATVLLEVVADAGEFVPSASWLIAYRVASLIDALQQDRRADLIAQTRFQEESQKSNNKLQKGSTSTSTANGGSTWPWGRAASVAPSPSAPQWIDQLSTEARRSMAERDAILEGLNESGDLETLVGRLYDADAFSPSALLHMIDSLSMMCMEELEVNRKFSLAKLTEFCTICTTTVTRLQWRNLWVNAEKVFVSAGIHERQLESTSVQAVHDLKAIAFHYLLKPERAMFSFQRDLLKPFEVILMQNASVAVRDAVMQAVYELVENRAAHLASGWGILFSCVSHAALMPELVDKGWEIVELVVRGCMETLIHVFPEWIFCLTSFACNGTNSRIASAAASLLLGCGHWLQYGLVSLPAYQTPPLGPAGELLSEDPLEQDVINHLRALQDTAAAGGGAEAQLLSIAPEEGDAAASDLPPSPNNNDHDTAGTPFEVARVALAPDMLSMDAKLRKPSGFGIKTDYHIWMSLFEGMVPIAIAHVDLHVRLHVQHCLWQLLHRYGVFFESSVQDGLLSGLLWSMVHSTATDSSLLLHPDKDAYLRSALLCTRGMLYACSRDGQWMERACACLERLCDSVCKQTALLSTGQFGRCLLYAIATEDFGGALPTSLLPHSDIATAYGTVLTLSELCSPTREAAVEALRGSVWWRVVLRSVVEHVSSPAAGGDTQLALTSEATLLLGAAAYYGFGPVGLERNDRAAQWQETFLSALESVQQKLLTVSEQAEGCLAVIAGRGVAVALQWSSRKDTWSSEPFQQQVAPRLWATAQLALERLQHYAQLQLILQATPATPVVGGIADPRAMLFPAWLKSNPQNDSIAILNSPAMLYAIYTALWSVLLQTPPAPTMTESMTTEGDWDSMLRAQWSDGRRSLLLLLLPLLPSWREQSQHGVAAASVERFLRTGEWALSHEELPMLSHLQGTLLGRVSALLQV